MVNPDILIVHEILSVGEMAFQAKSEAKMLKLIHGGTTALYVSHSVTAIEKLCNKVVRLNHGRVQMATTARKSATNMSNLWKIDSGIKIHILIISPLE